MVGLSLRYVILDVDRHGNRRFYFRRRGFPKVRLPGLPGSKEFMEAYATALEGKNPTPKNALANQEGSFGYVCKSYYASATFNALNISTRTWRRRVLDHICSQHGDKPIAQLESTHIRRLRDEKAKTPSASHARLKALNALFGWAIEEDIVVYDPTVGVKPLSNYSDGHHSWNPEEIAAFEAIHPVGSKARLAMSLMLYTACRRGDVVGLGPQHVKNGRLLYRQDKNKTRKPVDINIPLHDDLVKIIAETPIHHAAFLVTEQGRPFSVAGFGNKFRKWCNEAGLPHCSAHGLRKATAAHLAECGATSQEIMAITGHKSLKLVERYTSAADKPRMADAEVAKFKR
jgi:integrase/recombinase XerD